MVIVVPLALGVLTGYNLGSVALSYPILVPFFPTDISFITLVGFASLIFISSVVGYLISPIHLCNVVSSDYLKTDTTRMYKMYIPAALVMLVVQVIVIVPIIFIFGFRWLDKNSIIENTKKNEYPTCLNCGAKYPLPYSIIRVQSKSLFGIHKCETCGRMFHLKFVGELVMNIKLWST